jgi:hypothetical protein
MLKRNSEAEAANYYVKMRLQAEAIGLKHIVEYARIRSDQLNWAIKHRDGNHTSILPFGLLAMSKSGVADLTYEALVAHQERDTASLNRAEEYYVTALEIASREHDTSAMSMLFYNLADVADLRALHSNPSDASLYLAQANQLRKKSIAYLLEAEKDDSGLSQRARGKLVRLIARRDTVEEVDTHTVIDVPFDTTIVG